MYALFASTAYGLEELLKKELVAYGAQQLKLTQGGVYFHGDDQVLYTSLLCSRIASRILLLLHEAPINSAQDVYHCAAAIDWPALFISEHPFAVHFSGTHAQIRDSQYGALLIKDAIVDTFTANQHPRPRVDRAHPALKFRAWIKQNRVTIALDIGGASLHQRHYRLHGGAAPLKENLAAALVMRSGWHPGTALIDPMCGSGTLLIEAALMYADIAPGLLHPQFGVPAWRGFDAQRWQAVVATLRTRSALSRCQPGLLYGYDSDARAVQMAKANAVHAGVDALIYFDCADATQLVNPLGTASSGTLVCNLPYGARLASEPALMALHQQFGAQLKRAFTGWRVSLFSASTELMTAVGLRAERTFQARNGQLDCVQKNYLLAAAREPAPTDAAADYANRLRKNVQKRQKWAREQQIDCYRLYDADLPDYNVAVDRYGQWVVMQAYAAPKSIDKNKAQQRLRAAIAATLAVLQLPAEKLIVKTRQRQRGEYQYQRLAQTDEQIIVHERDVQFLVNLTDYVDTGLFLDHRAARRILQQMSRGKDFLNLFAYTGSATVCAAMGGARTTTSVDLSRTWLTWAEKNMQLNRLVGRQHQLIQADCLDWLTRCTAQFDLIFVDPPTFSNSKRMQQHFDIQRDHLMLLARVKSLLRSQGTIMFSNNKRGFKLDSAGLRALDLHAEVMTEQTQSADFRRQMHQCWLIRQGEARTT